MNHLEIPSLLGVELFENVLLRLLVTRDRHPTIFAFVTHAQYDMSSSSSALSSRETLTAG